MTSDERGDFLLLSRFEGHKNIAVIGCGALGSVFAGLLASAGHTVWAVCRWREHLEAIEARGLLLVEREQEIRPALRAFSHLPHEILASRVRCDLVIVLVKSFDTDSAAASLAGILPSRIPILTLQNGLGNAEALENNLPHNPILAGTTTFGALRERPGVVRLTGRGECEIGAWNRAADAELESVAGLLSGSGIPCSTSPDVKSVLWKKLAVSAVINPLTALLRVRNGELLAHKEVVLAFRDGVDDAAPEIVEEVSRVAAKLQIALPTPAELLEEVRRVCHLTAANRSSMLRDVEEARRTEIDAINGAVVRAGRECGIPAPANLFVRALVRAISPATWELPAGSHRRPT
ncbi:MAG: 2-dehydropantoate 2-reductase [Acidobacteria bacterium]|nr:2-dehydropantoate 2-reductase [Acidobacteriota bacterium]